MIPLTTGEGNEFPSWTMIGVIVSGSMDFLINIDILDNISYNTRVVVSVNLSGKEKSNMGNIRNRASCVIRSHQALQDCAPKLQKSGYLDA